MMLSERNRTQMTNPFMIQITYIFIKDKTIVIETAKSLPGFFFFFFFVAMKQEGRDLFVYFFQLGTRVIFAVIEIFSVIIVVLVIQLGFPWWLRG